MGVNLINVHLTGVYLTGVHLMGVYLINVHLTGVHLMGVHITGVHLTEDGRLYPPHLLQDVAYHLALSQQREAYAKQFPVVTICLFLPFSRSPGHPVNEIHVHRGFLAEEGDLVVDMDVCAVPASVNKRYLA